MPEFEEATIDVAFRIKFQRGTEPPDPDDFAAMVGNMLDGDCWQGTVGGGLWLLPMSEWYGDDDAEKDNRNGGSLGLAGIAEVRALGYQGD